ncbi:MAG TPA: ferredoxin [Patescibacteria group bacterium]|nr:ferredoxin [Patescibacteria group bacterium]
MVKVDKNKCIGCGLCAGMCPDTFIMDDDNISKVINTEDNDCAKNAKQNCPVGAISVD